ncbi:hypothetical protein [Krasilnikovia sp. MM14-A1004]|uniref:hypothetical protein n=1 Tax=Krasilnikovia sp. MM14-A1004 TaxID=3373541 RepID=UPI00399CD3E5
MDDQGWFAGMVRACDHQEIEFARPRVGPQHLPGLVELYGTLASWDQRLCLVQLVQDRHEPALQPIMLDILRAPERDDDQAELTKAAALCYLDGNSDLFMTYYEDRDALNAAVDKVLRANGLQLAPPEN